MGPFLYVTDLHGNLRKYERTLSLAVETGAWLVVNGGDMFLHGRMHGAQATFLREFLDPHFAKYQAAGIRYFGFPANDDLRVHDAQFDAICSRYPLVENLAGRKIPAGGWEEIPDWAAYARALPTIEEELAALPAPVDPGRAVYVIHGPPAGLGLDVVRGGRTVGSPATTRFVESARPLLTLHGHIHESPEESGVWMSRLGRTGCIQPGQSAAGLTVVVGDLEKMTLDRRVLPVD